MTDHESGDGQIIESIKGGDEAAFLSLYRKVQAPIFRFAFHMSGSRWVAEDVTQEVFLRLLHRSAGFDSSKGTLAGYLMGIARNCLLGRLKTEQPFAPGGRDPETGTVGSRGAHDPLSEMMRGEAVQLVRDAVLTLPIHYREVLVLCELEERSYQEASLILGCSTGTVRSRLHRAREMLVRKLRTTDLGLTSSRTKCVRCPA